MIIQEIAMKKLSKKSEIVDIWIICKQTRK